MSSRHWIPIYVGDYLRDTVELTTQEHGAYLLLLFAMWSSPDGTLPNEPIKLRRITGVARNQWKSVFAAIAPRLLIEGDRITQKRLQAELGKTKAKTLIRRAAGRLGADVTNSRKVSSSRPGYGALNSSPKPLTNNNGASAKADRLPRTTTTTIENSNQEGESGDAGEIQKLGARGDPLGEALSRLGSNLVTSDPEPTGKESAKRAADKLKGLKGLAYARECKRLDRGPAE